MHICLITKSGSGITGISRYTENLCRGLKSAGIDASLVFPQPFLVWKPLESGLKRLGLDFKAFFSNYPLKVQTGGADIYHLTTQTFASLLMVQQFDAPVVVTVLDILPYLLRHEKELNTFRHPIDELCYHLCLAGLKRAPVIVAISEYTRHTLIEALGLPSERIHVIYPQVDQNVFRLKPVPDSFVERYGLDLSMRHVLYVGTNDPRKNLPMLIQAFALLKQAVPHLKFIKVGADPFIQEISRMRILVSRLGLQEDILHFDHVSDEDLAYFYNFADLFVFPSLYEGFGLPVAEALACGTPVVCSNTTSLPEVAGIAARMVDPLDLNCLAKAMEEVLEDGTLQMYLRVEGLKQASKFYGDQAIVELMNIYKTLTENSKRLSSNL